jgi:uncharacterized cupredoxin-like copper-binding protein
MKLNKIFKGTWKLGIVFACIMALGCAPLTNVASAATYEPSKAPKIKSFKSSSTDISLGDTATLEWDVQNATSVKIIGLEKSDEEVLPLSGSIEVWPMATTTYILVATGPGGTASKSVTVNIDAVGDAKIDYFRASATEVVLGDIFTLCWKTSNVKKISIIGIEKGDEDVFPLTGSLEIFPTATTTYILQAEGVNGEVVSKTLTVNVVKGVPATIKYFKASATEIKKGENVTLSWSVKDAKTIEIKGVKGNLHSNGSLNLKPEKTTTYVLKAVGTDGVSVEKSLTVTVKPLSVLQITSFTASEKVVEKGTLVTLRWTTNNATGCMIVTSDGIKLENRPANGSISITPNKTRTYKLIAFDDNQFTAEESITITVK